MTGCNLSEHYKSDPRVNTMEQIFTAVESTESPSEKERIQRKKAFAIVRNDMNVIRKVLARIGYSEIASEAAMKYIFYITFVGGKKRAELSTNKKLEDKNIEMQLLGSDGMEIYGEHIRGVVYCLLQPKIVMNFARASEGYQKYAEKNIWFIDRGLFNILHVKTGSDGSRNMSFRAKYNDKIVKYQSEFREKFGSSMESHILNLESSYHELVDKTEMESCDAADYDRYAKLVPYLSYSDLFEQYN